MMRRKTSLELNRPIESSFDPRRRADRERRAAKKGWLCKRVFHLAVNPNPTIVEHGGRRDRKPWAPERAVGSKARTYETSP